MALSAVVLSPIPAACDWPDPPRVTVPPPVTWDADPATAGGYEAPVDGVVADPYRAPEHAYGPGNRGIEYRTDAGGPVRAARRGTVGFAGPVAGRLVVAIVHDGGRRTTYTGLTELSVEPGDAVTRGQRIGSTGASLHFGLKVGGEYVDPALVLGPPAVVLVPEPTASS